MKIIEKPVEIEQGDSFKVVLSKYGALALDKQESLSELIGDEVGDLDIEKGELALKMSPFRFRFSDFSCRIPDSGPGHGTMRISSARI